MSKMSRFAFAVLLSGVIFPAWAGDHVLRETMQEREGKSTTLLLTSGTELTGTVSKVGNNSVRLSELSGKEFFDAVVPLDKVEAVLIRSRGK